MLMIDFIPEDGPMEAGAQSGDSGLPYSPAAQVDWGKIRRYSTGEVVTGVVRELLPPRLRIVKVKDPKTDELIPKARFYVGVIVQLDNGTEIELPIWLGAKDVTGMDVDDPSLTEVEIEYPKGNITKRRFVLNTQIRDNSNVAKLLDLYKVRSLAELVGKSVRAQLSDKYWRWYIAPNPRE